MTSVAGATQSITLSGTSLLTSDQESARSDRLVATELPSTAAASSFDLIFESDQRQVPDPAFQSAVTAAMAPLAGDPRITGIIDPYDAPSPAEAAALISRDGHAALAVVSLRATGPRAWADYDALRAKVRSPDLRITATGVVPVTEAFNRTLDSDLHRAEAVTVPICLLLLVLIFGSVVAAALPIGVGLATIVGGLAATLLLDRVTNVSQYALNVVTLIGLGVSIDYSLFIVSRFRAEVEAGRSSEDAIAIALNTAGRAIAFSGLTVAVGLSALFFYQGTFLSSLGVAGGMVVAIAVFYGLVLLPALLSVLGPNVSRLAVPLIGGASPTSLWRSIANWVMNRPWTVLLPASAFLLALALPSFQLRLANGSVDILPSHVEARQGYDLLVRAFPGQADNTIRVVVHYPDGSPLTPNRIGDQFDLDRRVAALPGVLRTNSIYDVDPTLTRADYQRLYSAGASEVPAALRPAFHASVGRDIVVIDAVTGFASASDAAQKLVSEIRANNGLADGAELLVGGQTAIDMDIVKFVRGRTPLAAGFVILVTYVVLFLFTGSLVLPLKAVLMNLLSIGASFGALVWIFQQGHLADVLGFTAQPIDPAVPVILFAVVFGMSMDYEVLLVSRIQEEYRGSGDNASAVAIGLEQSGRLITGAAATMVTVFLAFGLAEVVIIKALGIGLAIAVALDATIVRVLVVPAAMRLLGRWNWWAPKLLTRYRDSKPLPTR